LDSAAAEIALALKVAPITAGSRLADAIDLSQRLPATLDALCDGRITLPKARALSAETVNLSDANRAQVEVEALTTAAGMTPGKLRGNVRRIIERLDPAGLVDRTAKARAERGVSLYPKPDGVATISADMPIEQALAVYGVIDSLAHTMLNAPGEERTIDQFRCDVLFDLICHPPTGSSRIDYTVQVLVPADMLLNNDTEQHARTGDGTIIPDEIAKAIAADARWQRVLTDPVNGQLLDLGRNRYRPSKPLAEFIRTRDKRCRWPGCRQPAHRADLDHTVAFGNGEEGETIRINLSCLCRKHHRIKHLPGWKCRQEPDGEIIFTTPHGEEYRTRPPTADGAEKPVETKSAFLVNYDEIPPF
jgi:hypothetical protein